MGRPRAPAGRRRGAGGARGARGHVLLGAAAMVVLAGLPWSLAATQRQAARIEELAQRAAEQQQRLDALVKQADGAAALSAAAIWFRGPRIVGSEFYSVPVDRPDLTEADIATIAKDWSTQLTPLPVE